MSYELNKERYHNMDKKRTLGLISACDIEIPISKNDYNYFIKDEKYMDVVNELEKRISDWFSKSNIKDAFEKSIHMSLLPDFKENNFFLGYSPRDILSTIFRLLEIDTTELKPRDRVDIKYFNQMEYEYQRNIVAEILNRYIMSLRTPMRTLMDNMNQSTNSTEFGYYAKIYNILDEKCNFAIEALNHIDDIFNLYNDRTLSNYTTCRVKVDGKGAKNEEDYHIIWKNLAHLLAIKSLDIYEATENDLYLEYPFKFYEKCTRPDQDNKKMVYVNKYQDYDPEFKKFNSRCEEIFINSPLALDFLLNYKDNNKILVYEIFKPKKISFTESELKDFIEHKVGKSGVVDKDAEREKADRQLQSKLAFYSHDSEFGKHVVARTMIDGQKNNGYMGFVLDNDNIVLDRFYRECKDGTSVPVIDEAIYGLPLDLYETFGRNMSVIKKHKTCPLVLHKYHTESESYRDALMELTKKESVSLLKAEQFASMHGIRLEETSKPKKTKKYTKKKNNKKTE